MHRGVKMEKKIETAVKKIHKDEKGLTLLEYAAGAAFVLIIATTAFGLLNGGVHGLFSAIGGKMTSLGGQITLTPPTNP
jgi:Flp pilus assembly pilin Flp